MGVINVAMSRAPATLNIPKNPAVRREWISFHLRCLGLSYRELARREGVSHQAVSAAALGGGYRHLQETIAAAIGHTPQDLWPELYDDHGERLGRTREPKRTTRRPGGNDEREHAA